MLDCNEACVPASWLGDGYYDASYEYNGVLVDLSCEELGFDNGDCETLLIDADLMDLIQRLTVMMVIRPSIRAPL